MACEASNSSDKNRSITGTMCGHALSVYPHHSTRRESAERWAESLTDGHWCWGTEEPHTGSNKALWLTEWHDGQQGAHLLSGTPLSLCEICKKKAFVGKKKKKKSAWTALKYGVNWGNSHYRVTSTNLYTNFFWCLPLLVSPGAYLIKNFK